MLLKSIKKLIGISTLALVATAGLTNHAMAQKGGTGVMNGEVTWPTSFTLMVGGQANDNFQGNGAFDPGNGNSYTQSHGLANPEFHIGAEIPIASNMMFVPRLSYNDYSVRWDNAQGGVGAPLAVSYLALGADLLFKYSLNSFHILAGGNVSTPVKATQATSYTIEAATQSTQTIPDKSNIIASLKGGLGYDIPLNGSNTIWLTPEAMYTYPITNFVQPPTHGSELFVTSLSGGASLKFSLP